MIAARYCSLPLVPTFSMNVLRDLIIYVCRWKCGETYTVVSHENTDWFIVFRTFRRILGIRVRARVSKYNICSFISVIWSSTPFFWRVVFVWNTAVLNTQNWNVTKFLRLLLLCIGIHFISSSHRTCFLQKFPLGDSSKFINRWSTHGAYVYKLKGYLGKGFVT